MSILQLTGSGRSHLKVTISRFWKMAKLFRVLPINIRMFEWTRNWPGGRILGKLELTRRVIIRL